MSVVTNGLPVPVARMTTRPLSRWDKARRRMNGSATSSMRIVVISRVSQPSFSSASCRARPLITVAVIPM